MGIEGAILDHAGRYLGLQEWPGARHNQQIVDFFKDVGHGWVKDDETPWCAAFVGAVLSEVGVQHTGKLNARSYADWGYDVKLSDAKPGDICVFWRGHPNAATGHVAFFVRYVGDKVLVRGGNQGNKVSDALYPVSRLLCVRRADFAASSDKSRPTLRVGDKGAFVLDLQDQLKRLRYFAGKLDGVFGPLTNAAVQAFQSENKLVVDGVVGMRTWRALGEAEPRAERDVSVDDLRAARSRTVELADDVETKAVGAGQVVTAVPAVDTALDVARRITDGEDMLAALQQTIVDNWLVILIGVVGVVVWVYGPKVAKQMRDIRLEDARSGANVAR